MEEDVTTNWLKETKKGYIRLIVLTLLSKRPYYGYEIMKEVREKTGGVLRFTSGGVYRILQDLEQSKYVQGEWGAEKRRKRKTYKITDRGMSILQRALTKESELANSMHELFKEYLRGVLGVRVPLNETLRAPHLFSMFLEARTGKPEDSIRVLEEKNAEIERMIRKLRKLQGANRRRVTLLENVDKTTTRT